MAVSVNSIKNSNMGRYEDALHEAVCKWVKLQYPDAEIHHSPNEGKRNGYQQYRVKAMCVSAGFPDLFLLHGQKKCAVELKAIPPDGKKKTGATPAQLRWIEALNRAGIPASVCRGFDEAKAFINSVFAK